MTNAISTPRTGARAYVLSRENANKLSAALRRIDRQVMVFNQPSEIPAGADLRELAAFEAPRFERLMVDVLEYATPVTARCIVHIMSISSIH